MQQLIDAFLDNLKSRALSDYTARCYRKDLEMLAQHLEGQGTDFLKATPENIIRYMEYLRAMNYAGTSMYRKISCFRTFYKFLKKTGNASIQIDVPYWMKERATRKKVVWTEGDVQKFFQTMVPGILGSNRELLIATLIYQTGVKLSEIVNVNMQDLDVEHNQLKVRRHGREDVIALDDNSVQRAKTYIQSRTGAVCDSLFVNKDGKKISARSVRRNLEKYSSRAGLVGEVARILRNIYREKKKGIKPVEMPVAIPA